MSEAARTTIGPGPGLHCVWVGAERRLDASGWLSVGDTLVHVETSYGTARLTWPQVDRDDLIVDLDLPERSTLADSLSFIERAILELVRPL